MALSVSTSIKTSPVLTSSPSCLTQRAIVPSCIVSERRGMTISSGMRLSCHDAAGGADRDAPVAAGRARLPAAAACPAAAGGARRPTPRASIPLSRSTCRAAP